MPDEYPEHEKLQKVKDTSQAIGEFLEWCDGRGWHLAEWDESRQYQPRMMPLSGGVNDVLAEYFDIDLNTLEAEKRAMLDRQRDLNAKAGLSG